MPAANLQPLLPEQIAQHPAAGKWVIQVQLVDAPHQRTRSRPRDWPRLVDAAAADLKHFSLFWMGRSCSGSIIALRSAPPC